MPMNNFLGTEQVPSCASSISLLQTNPKSSHTGSWTGSTTCHCWKGQKLWQYYSTSPLTPGMRSSFLCCWWHVCHGTDLAALALTQPELLSLLQERIVRYSGKIRLSCTVIFFPSTPLQLSSAAKPLLSDPSPLLTSSQKDAEPPA